jgi:alanine racemase
LYDKVADLIIAHKIDRVIGIGETISAFKTKFANAVTYNTASFITDFDTLDFNNETVLIKGARTFQFEEIVYSGRENTRNSVRNQFECDKS